MTDSPLRATISLRGVVVAPDDELLVVRRSSNGEWELPGGRLDAREDVLPGLRREISEETGLDITVREPVHTISWRNDADRSRFGVYYDCIASSKHVSLSEEHTSHEWTTAAEAVMRLSDPQARAVERTTTLERRE